LLGEKRLQAIGVIVGYRQEQDALISELVRNLV
jgi:hypothetical protein